MMVSGHWGRRELFIAQRTVVDTPLSEYEKRSVDSLRQKECGDRKLDPEGQKHILLRGIVAVRVGEIDRPALGCW